jgi:hypothetical protein
MNTGIHRTTVKVRKYGIPVSFDLKFLGIQKRYHFYVSKSPIYPQSLVYFRIGK